MVGKFVRVVDCWCFCVFLGYLDIDGRVNRCGGAL